MERFLAFVNRAAIVIIVIYVLNAQHAVAAVAVVAAAARVAAAEAAEAVAAAATVPTVAAAVRGLSERNMYRPFIRSVSSVLTPATDPNIDRDSLRLRHELPDLKLKALS